MAGAGGGRGMAGPGAHFIPAAGGRRTPRGSSLVGGPGRLAGYQAAAVTGGVGRGGRNISSRMTGGGGGGHSSSRLDKSLLSSGTLEGDESLGLTWQDQLTGSTSRRSGYFPTRLTATIAALKESISI